MTGGRATLARPPDLRGSRLDVLAAICLMTAAGGAMDAWVYVAHGHVFANAQSGNIVLMGVKLAAGDRLGAAAHLPPLIAF